MYDMYRLRHIEAEIKDNLNKVQQVQVIQDQRKLIFGELENDADDLTGAIKDLNSQIRQSFSKMDLMNGQVCSSIPSMQVVPNTSVLRCKTLHLQLYESAML
jgi:hypothetical protein